RLDAFLTGGPVGSAPTSTSFTPTSGPVGSSVTISGTNFTGATAVTFNGVSAAPFTVISDTAIQDTVPPGSTTGPLRVTTPGGTATSTSAFTVVSAPAITSFTPTSGPVGSSATISGTNFTGATAVTVNGVSASFTVTSATAIQALVPAGATTGPLSVTTPGGTATSTSAFTVVSNDAPIAASIFVGAEDPLSENGAWAALTSLAPNGTRFQKNNGAYPDRLIYADVAGARTTAAVPDDHYSEIVVGHVGSNINNVGPIVRVQAS